MQTAKTLIRLGKCPGLSESSLGAHSFCWFCHVAAHLFYEEIKEVAILIPKTFPKLPIHKPEPLDQNYAKRSV